MAWQRTKVKLKPRPGYEWVIVLGLVAAIYLLIGLAVPRLFSGFIGAYVVQPILWCFLILITLLVSRYGGGGKLHFTRSLLWMAILVGIFQVGLAVIAGILLGFGHSPYSHTPQMIFINFAFMASALVGIEFSRAYLVNTFGERKPVLIIALTAVLYTVVMIPLVRFIGLGDGMGVLTFFGGTIIPLLALNLLASFLALLGGPVACLAYVGVLELFEWYSPILPDLSWAAAAIVGLIAPAIGFMVVQSRFLAKAEPAKAKSKTKKRGPSVIGWIVVVIICLGIIWFSFGLVGFHPTIVGSGSMSPVMNVGDIAIVRETSADGIELGDIISYEREGIEIMHRVIEIQGEGGSKLFITQGDANASPDPHPVHPDQIKGKIIFVIPKLGWVGVWIKGLFS